MSINLTIQHPDFVATAHDRQKSRDLFDGQGAVKDKRDVYLYREKNESDDDYELRLKRAVLDPWVEKIVAARQAMLFAKSHSRELPAQLDLWQSDMDMLGTPADVFFHDAAREAQVDGIHWVLVDAPRTPTDEQGKSLLKSALDEKNSGLRPFFQRIPADAVIDWEVGPDRKLLWAVITESNASDRGEQGWGCDPEAREQWKVWTRSQWLVYEATEVEGNGSERESYELVEQGVNPFGEVPLVPFFGVKRTDHSGWPVAKSVLGHILQIYNKESDLDWFERLSAHPIPYTIGKDKPTRLDAAKGFHLKSEPGYSTAVGYLETTGQGFASLRESIKDLRFRIYSIALAQAQKDSAQVQSADSQREDRRIFTSSLKSASISLEASERRCWEIMARWGRGADSSGIKITYSRDFDDRIIEAAMINAFKDLAVAEMLPVDDVLQLLIDGDILPADYDIEEAKVKIAQDVDRRSLGAMDTGHASEPGPVMRDQSI